MFHVDYVHDTFAVECTAIKEQKHGRWLDALFCERRRRLVELKRQKYLLAEKLTGNRGKGGRKEKGILTHFPRYQDNLYLMTVSLPSISV